MGFLSGKKALITGVASQRSIASGIAEAMHREGAELAFTYQGDKLKPRVEELAHSTGSSMVLPLDVTRDAEIAAVFDALKQQWGGIDVVIHSIGFAPRELLAGSYLDTVTREGYALAHDISAYSFAALGKAARPLMQGRPAALLTLTYLGSERYVPMYNVMGAAKASLRSQRTLHGRRAGAAGDPRQHRHLSPARTRPWPQPESSAFAACCPHAEQGSALKRNVTIEEVGNAAAFLCSDLASGITGEILYVDAGFNIMGFSLAESENKS